MREFGTGARPCETEGRGGSARSTTVEFDPSDFSPIFRTVERREHFCSLGSHRLDCVEIQVRPSRKRWFPRTGAERTLVGRSAGTRRLQAGLT
ncbi:MAG: hypothetical protein EOR82_26115 [Mesorhizobium sp.]|nr:MAG: hypothetical protein EOR82_26115 [Mesorhizobium sp.]TJV55697.1 MAG: hypothetical protein E5X82_26410 [Mesorhizobium sp.]